MGDEPKLSAGDPECAGGAGELRCFRPTGLAFLVRDTGSMAELDHVIIHIDDWESCTAFYSSLLDAEVIDNPVGAGNPLGSVVYRDGGQQINVHGPWPGMPERCCPEPFDRIGGLDLAFRIGIAPDETLARLGRLGIEVVEGPVRRFGPRGWGVSLYCRDPSGNGVELISYEQDSPELS